MYGDDDAIRQPLEIEKGIETVPKNNKMKLYIIIGAISVVVIVAVIVIVVLTTNGDNNKPQNNTNPDKTDGSGGRSPEEPENETTEEKEIESIEKQESETAKEQESESKDEQKDESTEEEKKPTDEKESESKDEQEDESIEEEKKPTEKEQARESEDEKEYKPSEDENESKPSEEGKESESEEEKEIPQSDIPVTDSTDEPDVDPDKFEVNLTTIPLPEDILIDDGHYLFDGNIFICYNRNITDKTDYKYFGIISDDGQNFKELYGDVFIVSDKANGIRLIPFRDNKRVYLGDFVFECNDTTKNLSECEKGVLIPVNYPSKVVNNTYTYKTWSEMVVAPDNIHVAWTSLNLACGAVNFIGKFERKENSYEIIEPKIISTINFIEKDPNNKTILIPKTPRGGEIKQFIEGGNALTLVGTLPDTFVKSVYQSLTKDEIYAYSHETGYEETTILSPDEKLGIAMSTRFSPNTSMSILGLMPRPYSSLILAKMAQNVYTYAITGVREGRKGNIGPVLFNKERSMSDSNYHGIDLHDKEEIYRFCSPISWHPSNLKALWPETDVHKNRRLRKLEISNYTPSEYPKIQNTTDNIPYALDMSEFDKIHFEEEIDGFIKGKYSGEIEYYNSGSSSDYSKKQTVKVIYNNYSDDGKKFYNGEEYYEGSALSGCIFRSNVNLTGTETGQNNFTLSFSTQSKLIKDKTEGYATYGGKTIRAENYLE